MLLDHKVFVGRGNHRRDRSWARNLLDTNHNGPSDDNISNRQQLKLWWVLHWKLDPGWPARRCRDCDQHAGSPGLQSRSRLVAQRLRASLSRSRPALKLPSSLGLAQTRHPVTAASNMRTFFNLLCFFQEPYNWLGLYQQGLDRFAIT